MIVCYYFTPMANHFTYRYQLKYEEESRERKRSLELKEKQLQRKYEIAYRTIYIDTDGLQVTEFPSQIWRGLSFVGVFVFQIWGGEGGGGMSLLVRFRGV